MNALIRALIDGLLVGIGLLTVAWTGEGVNTFSDITSLQYAVIGLTVIATVLKDLQSLFAKPPQSLTKN